MQVAGERGAHLSLLERADVRRQFVGQHRDDAVGEIDAVAARARFAVEFGSGADVEADVGNRDDRVPAVAVIARRCPDRVVMVARIFGVDRDDREMGEVFALAQRELRDLMCFIDRFTAKLVAQAVLGDRDHREAARRERVAEHRVDPRGHPRRAPRGFGEDKVAGLRGPKLANLELAPLALVDRGQEMALAHLADHAQDHLGRALELLHDMRDMARARFFGPREDTVVEGERRAPPALDHAQPRRGGISVPGFGRN